MLNFLLYFSSFLTLSVIHTKCSTSAKPLMLRRNSLFWSLWRLQRNGPSSGELRRALEKQIFLRRLRRNRPFSRGSGETGLPPEAPEKQTFLQSLRRNRLSSGASREHSPGHVFHSECSRVLRRKACFPRARLEGRFTIT